jgi:hypothetical protein
MEEIECLRVGTLAGESHPSIERFTIRVSRSLLRYAWAACGLFVVRRMVYG